eukprot:2129498-Pyramimonas_sp.AAC.1
MPGPLISSVASVTGCVGEMGVRLPIMGISSTSCALNCGKSARGCKGDVSSLVDCSALDDVPSPDGGAAVDVADVGAPAAPACCVWTGKVDAGVDDMVGGTGTW